MEGVGVRSDHHHYFLQGISSASELRPVDSVLVATAVMSASVPDAVQVGVSAGVVPPASLLIVGAVT